SNILRERGNVMELSKEVQLLTSSPTLEISTKSKELKKQGHKVIDLSLGEPDFNTPLYINKAAKKAIDDGHTKYTASDGIYELKKAIIEKLEQDNNLIYYPDEIIVTTGAKFALYEIFKLLINEGDEVIIPTPYWVSYPAQVRMAGAKPVYIKGEEKNKFKITKQQLEETITSKTKLLILNSPNNPTGMLYSEEELKALGDICVKNNILIVSDEIYEKLVYTNSPHVSIASLSSYLKSQTIIVNGVSKSHAMT